MNYDAWKIILVIPVFIIGCVLFYYSPARIIKKLLGKESTGKNDKTFFEHSFTSFLDLSSTLLAIILLAVAFHWFLRLFQPH